VCRVGFKERRKGVSREIVVNHQYRRIYIEVYRACYFLMFNPQENHYPEKGALDFILIKLTRPRSTRSIQ
jgi:hypothetical protein